MFGSGKFILSCLDWASTSSGLAETAAETCARVGVSALASSSLCHLLGHCLSLSGLLLSLSHLSLSISLDACSPGHHIGSDLCSLTTLKLAHARLNSLIDLLLVLLILGFLECSGRGLLLLEVLDVGLDFALVGLGTLMRLLHGLSLFAEGLVKRPHVADLAGELLRALALHSLVALPGALNDTTVEAGMLHHVHESFFATSAADVLVVTKLIFAALFNF